MVENIKSVLESTRNDESEFDGIYRKCDEMAKLADVELAISRRCGRQSQ